jgi:Mrp family chromosome partitioning ATPase
LPEKRKIRDVNKVIAVSSAKGGVGKSTIAGAVPTMSSLSLEECHLGGRQEPSKKQKKERERTALEVCLADFYFLCDWQ